MDFSDQHRSYQKQLLLYNRHLPYAELLEDESRSLFEDIKQNLSIAVQKKELWPGALYWTNRLTRYSLLVAYPLYLRCSMNWVSIKLLDTSLLMHTPSLFPVFPRWNLIGPSVCVGAPSCVQPTACALAAP